MEKSQAFAMQLCFYFEEQVSSIINLTKKKLQEFQFVSQY